jgi:hypothetical protein
MRRRPDPDRLPAPRRAALLLAATAVAAVALLMPTWASADFQTLYDDYRTDTVIDGCAYSSGELTSGLGDIPADIREYDPGFSNAINAALEQAAAGCGAAAPEATPKNEVFAADGSPGPAPPRPRTVVIADTDEGLPALLVALIVLGTATLAAGAALAAAHYNGWDVRRGLAPVSGAEERLAERLRSLRDRLGF